MQPHDAQIKTISLNGATFCFDVAGDHRGDFKAFSGLTDRYRLLAYDQRGCGRSSVTAPFNFEQYADDLEAFRQELCGGKRIILIGGSFGGMQVLVTVV